jgi:hypothetical protein
MQRHDERAPDELLTDRTLDWLETIEIDTESTYYYVVPITNPTAQGLVDPSQLDPVCPCAVDHAVLEDRTGKEDNH